jgi:hypothetical protein
MARGVPVLRQHDMIKSAGEFADDRRDRVSIRNFEAAIGTKIPLHINDQQNVIPTNLEFRHFHLPLS